MSAPGELIAQRYRLKRNVGAGGMGVVWEAFDERLHRTVAVKALHPQPWLSDAESEVVTHRALREARITARLNHPHAVPVYDVVEDQGRPCLVMQFLQAEPLSSVLQHRGPLPEPDVAELGAQLASALEAAHKVGIVHRDVKPGNVLISQDGTARISDFGIAHALGDVTLTATGLVAGTPEYLAPEVAQGHEPGFPADVFSLGATLYAALEGRPPFGTDTNRIALLHRVAAGVIDAPQRSGALTSLLADMLAAEPRDRPTMSEVTARLVTMRDTGQSQAPGLLLTTGTTTESTDLPPTAPGSSAERDDPPPTVGMPSPRAERPSPVAAPPGTGSNGPLTRRHTARQPVAAAATALPRTQQVTAPSSRPAGSPTMVTSSRHALPKGRRRRSPASSRARATAALVTVLVLLVPLLLLINSRNDAGDVSATAPTAVSAPGGTPTPTSAAPTVAAAPATPSASSSTPPSASPSAATSTPSAAASAPPSVASAGLTAADSARAVTSYYSLLPTNTDRTWPLMTASYQAGKAGGRASYQRFWDAYSRVTATDVSAVGPSTVEATITYYAKDGRVVRERTSFGLVNDGGVVKIDTSRVLSSSSS